MEVSGIAGAQLILAGDVNPLSVIAEPSTHFLGCDLRIMPGEFSGVIGPTEAVIGFCY